MQDGGTDLGHAVIAVPLQHGARIRSGDGRERVHRGDPHGDGAALEHAAHEPGQLRELRNGAFLTQRSQGIDERARPACR